MSRTDEERVAPAPSEPWRFILPRAHEPRLQRGLFGVLWVTFVFFGSTPSWNPNTRFDLVRAIVEEGRVAIDSFHKNTGDKSVRDSHVYSDKAPGLAFLAVPIHFARQLLRQLDPYAPPNRPDELTMGALYLCTMFTVSLWSALAGVVLFQLARRLGASARRSLWVVVAYSLATPALAYSSLFFAHQLVASLLLLAAALALRTGEPPTVRLWLAMGALLAAAVASEYPAALGALPLVVWAARRMPRPISRTTWVQMLGGLAGGALVPTLLLAIYNTTCFGAPWRIGYGSLVPSEFATGMSRGFFGVGWPSWEAVWGITGGGSRGLFWVSPICLVALAGLVWAALRRPWRHEARLFLVIVAAFFLLNGSYVFWNGGAAFGPRHMVPMLPFLCLGLVALPTRPRWIGYAASGILILSLANAFGAAAVGADLPEHGNVLLDHIWRHLIAGEIPFEQDAYNLGNVLGLSGRASLLPLAVFLGAAAPLLFRLARTIDEDSRLS